jgi:hypothetical protein
MTLSRLLVSRTILQATHRNLVATHLSTWITPDSSDRFVLTNSSVVYRVFFVSPDYPGILTLDKEHGRPSIVACPHFSQPPSGL